MPKFSIIVGVYNQVETLPLLIQSLEQQTFKDFEVHFCDDGSTDGSLELLKSELLNLTYHIHTQKNKGMRLAKNLNQGIRAARGEHCVLVMADSMLEADYLEVLSSWVHEERIVCGIRIQIAQNAEGKPEGVDMDWRVKKNIIPQFPSVSISMPWACLTGNGLTIPTEAFRKYGLLWEGPAGYGGEDTEIISRLFHKGYVCWSVPDLRLYHHWHKSKDSNSKTQGIVNRKIKEYAR